MTTLNERMAILETEVKGMKRILWLLSAGVLAQVGIQLPIL